jgi:alpha-mannosidase
MSLRPLDSAYCATTASIKQIRPNAFELRNAQFIVQVTDGGITSLYDIKADRELIPKGKKAAQLVIFDDKPLYWQAWDVEVFHLASRTELHPQKVEITHSGPHVVELTLETKISDKSWAKTKLRLPAAIADEPTCIEVHAEVEWRETMQFLKVEFPVDIVNTEASYETQFGVVRRPTHYNTSWDMAKFEVCCHKWADLSEATYGVSILNDSKYGFAVAGDVMRLSLLRAPKAPDADADMGRHVMRYGMFPHTGALDSRTVRKAFEFNNPLKYVATQYPGGEEEGPRPTSTETLLGSFRVLGADNLVLDTIKRGEDDEDVSRGELPVKKGKSVILRVYDALGGKSKGVVTWGDLEVKKVVKVNALEDEVEDLSKAMVDVGDQEEGEDGDEELGVGETKSEAKAQGVKVEVRAFEVVTLKLVL